METSKLPVLLSDDLRPDFQGCLFVVSSVKSQWAQPTMAAELYTSYWFRLARALVQARGPWMILSPRHGLLHPDQVVAPYSKAEGLIDPSRQSHWRETVQAALLAKTPPGGQAVFLSGRRYDKLLSSLRGAGLQVDTPLLGLTLDEQVVWLRGQLEAADIAEPPLSRTRSDEERSQRRQRRAARRQATPNRQRVDQGS